MKYPIVCNICLNEGMKLSEALEMHAINDSGRYLITCKNNHTSLTILQQEKFQILFAIGCYAINDGYYREAVSSFTSALERFYEFFIKAICISKNIDYEIIQKTWKNVSNQSERQLGAFIFLHLFVTEDKAKILDDKNVSFRNSVIHKGKIPSKDEAIKYGQAILDLIRPLIKLLIKDYRYATDILNMMHLKEKGGPLEELGEDTLVVTTSQNSILSLYIEDPSFYEKSLEEFIEELQLNNKHFPK